MIKYLMIFLLMAANAHAFNYNFDWGGGSSIKYEDITSSLSVSPTTNDYGSKDTGTNTDQVFAYTGTEAEEISLSVTGTGYSLLSTTCGSNPFDLLTGTCTATVRFTPASAGTLTGSLIASWTNQSDVVVSLTGVGIATGCSETPTVTYTSGTSTDVFMGYSDNRTSLGNQYAGASTYNACAVGLYMKIGAGTVTGKTYVAKVYSTTGNNANLGTLKGTSATVSGSVLTSTAAEVKFTFSTAVAITTNDVVIVVTSDNTRDSSNYAAMQYGSGLANWSWNQYAFDGAFYTDDGTKTLNFNIYE